MRVGLGPRPSAKPPRVLPAARAVFVADRTRFFLLFAFMGPGIYHNGKRRSQQASIGEEECLSERPPRVAPLAHRAEARPSSHFNDFTRTVLVGTLCPDCLAFAKIESVRRFPNSHSLPGRRTEMHFDPALIVVPAYAMIETRQIKVCVEITVYSRQHVLIEGGGDSGRVVIGRKQLRNGLHKVCSQQKTVTHAKYLPYLMQKRIRSRPVEVSNCASEEQD